MPDGGRPRFPHRALRMFRETFLENPLRAKGNPLGGVALLTPLSCAALWTYGQQGRMIK
jgi:hypothetical protein